MILVMIKKMFINRLPAALHLLQYNHSLCKKISTSTGGERFTSTSSKSLGDALELRVARIAQLLGHSNIRRNVILIDSNGNKSEADVVFGRFFPTYVECKNYAISGNSVGLEEVAKWRMVLELNKIPLSRGLFVTTSKFSPRARTIGVKCYDSDQLNQWERYAQRVFYVRRLLFRLISMTLFFAIGLITAVAISPLLVERYPFLVEKSNIYKRLLKNSSQTNSNDIEAIKLWAMNNMAVLRLGFAEFRDAVNAAVEETLGGTSSSSPSPSLRSSIPSLRSFFEDEENDRYSSFETPLPVVLLLEALLKMNRGFVNGWRKRDEQQFKHERKKKEEEEMKKKSMNRMLVDAADVLSSWYQWLEGNGGEKGDDRIKATRRDNDNKKKKVEEEEEEKMSFVAGSRLRNAYEKVKGILQQ